MPYCCIKLSDFKILFSISCAIFISISRFPYHILQSTHSTQLNGRCSVYCIIIWSVRATSPYIWLCMIASVYVSIGTLSNSVYDKEKPNRNVSCARTILIFPSHIQKLIAHHCLYKYSLLFIAEYTREVARTHCIWLFPCRTRNLIAYHCSCKYSLLFIAEYTRGLA